jgi:hypothetical protein
VLKGLVFVRSGCFVNTSRIHPKLLTVESRRMKLAGQNTNAVGIMLGVATECFLVTECTGGSQAAPYPIHKISIVPFAQEMRRDTSVWGKLFNFHVISGSVSSFGISFLTRRQRKVFSTSLNMFLTIWLAVASAPPSPSKSGGLFITVSNSLVTSSQARGRPTGGTFYPASRGFEERSK